MATITTARLSFKLIVDDEVGDMLRVTITNKKGAKEHSYYSIARHPEMMDVFSLRKLVHSDEQPEAYVVNLREGSCTCPWQTYRSSRPETLKNGAPTPNCRHLDGVLALVEAGEF